MRQIGTLENETLADRFVDYLTTVDISAMCEADHDGWIIWVRDENQLEPAREKLKRFAADPEAEQYQEVQRQATELRTTERKRRRDVKKNLVAMGGNWSAPLSKRAPMVMALIVISVGVGIFSGLNLNRTGSVQRVLMFADLAAPGGMEDGFINIRQGQVWRLATPMFLHGGPIHLIFNMLWLYYLGGQVESKRGATRFAAMVIVIAVGSNVIQEVAVGPWFGGMSGVVYGLFGYIWVRRSDGYQLSRQTIAIVMIFFVLGFAGFLGNVANMAHTAGLAFGAILGYYPDLLAGPRRPPSA